MSFSIFCSLLGMTMNLTAVFSNSKVMPVYPSEEFRNIHDFDVVKQSDRHILVEDISNIKYTFLIDKYEFGDWIFSIGDIFLWLGVLICISGFFVYLNLHNFYFKLKHHNVPSSPHM